jgi:U3 small nucleolar RNA-associated protein 20
MLTWYLDFVDHSDAEHFHPLLESMLSRMKEVASDVRYVGLSSRLMFTVCGVRMGNRVAEWKPVLDVVSLLLDAVDNSTVQEPSPMQDCLSAISVDFQYCPLDSAIPHVSIFERLTKGFWEPYFLPFCNLFAELGPERFHTLLLPYFKRCVTCLANVSLLCLH